MKTQGIVLVTLWALIAAPLISRGRQNPQQSEAQTKATGTIRGTVVREGTDEPIPDVEITAMNRTTLTGAAAAARLKAATDALQNAIRSNPAMAMDDAGIAQSASRALADQTVITDADGHFVLRNVTVGEISLSAQRKGYFAFSYGTYSTLGAGKTVTLTADETVTLKMELTPGGTINGRILDPAGKPLPDAMVQIFEPNYSNGKPTVDLLDQVKTDDRGEYRISRLRPGDYFISAGVSQFPGTPRGSNGAPRQEAIVTTFYPSAADQTFAQKITLHSGDELTGMNIQIKTAPTAKVSGKVISAVMAGVTTEGGQPRVGAVYLVPRDTTRGTLGPGRSNTVPVGVEGGDFEFQGVTPGTYDIMARLTAATGNGWGPYNTPQTATHAWAFGRVTVEVRGSDVADIKVVVRPGVDIKGRLFLDGKPIRANARITLAADDALQDTGDQQFSLVLNQIRQYAAPIADDGSFTIPLVPEGRYRVQVSLNSTATAAARGAAGRGATTAVAPPAPQLPKEAYLADIRQEGISVYDDGLTVGTGEAHPLDVLLNTTARGTIQGEVRTADGKPAPRATVVLIPPDSRSRNAALYKDTTTDAQGHYVINDVAPGNYTVYAWESVKYGSYQNAEFLSQFAGRGKAVTIQAGTKSAADMTVIPKNSGSR